MKMQRAAATVNACDLERWQRGGGVERHAVAPVRKRNDFVMFGSVESGTQSTAVEWFRVAN